MSVPLLSVVVPVHCEAEALPGSLAAIRDAMAGLGEAFEIVVVDDGSTDGTWERARLAVSRWPEVVAVSLARNFGKEAAVLAGLDAARGEAVIVMDGDLQHPPALLPRLVALWREGDYQVVSAVKRRRQAEHGLKRVLARLYYRLFERLAGVRVASSSDYKLLDRRVVDLYRQLPERSLFFRGLVPWLGFRQVDVPFDVEDRREGRSKWSPFKLLRLAIGSVVSFSTIPLQFVTFAGLMFLAVAVLLGAQTLYQKLTGAAIEGFTTLILLLLFTGAVLMIALGIIGQYVAKIYEEVKQRPRYIVSRSDLRNREAAAPAPADRRRTRRRVLEAGNVP